MGRTANRFPLAGIELSENYFGAAPLAHALFRAAELVKFGEQGFEASILDLGCGAGEFAQRVMLETLDCGIDLSVRQVARAARTGKYRELCQGDAGVLPFADESFATILSISALEHMVDPDRVLAEGFRVLKPGGMFVGTVVLRDLHQHLSYSRLLQRAGLRWLANLYIRTQDRLFQHVTMLSEQCWRRLWEEAGFEIEQCRRVVSPRITRLWDMLLPLAFPYWLGRKVGLNLVWHPRWLVHRLQKVLETERDIEDNQGSCLYFVLRKPGNDRADDDNEPLPREEAALELV